MVGHRKIMILQGKQTVDSALAMEPIMEGAKQREFQRNMAAARYRQKSCN